MTFLLLRRQFSCSSVVCQVYAVMSLLVFILFPLKYCEIVIILKSCLRSLLLPALQIIILSLPFVIFKLRISEQIENRLKTEIKTSPHRSWLPVCSQALWPQDPAPMKWLLRLLKSSMCLMPMGLISLPCLWSLETINTTSATGWCFDKETSWYLC